MSETDGWSSSAPASNKKVVLKSLYEIHYPAPTPREGMISSPFGKLFKGGGKKGSKRGKMEEKKRKEISGKKRKDRKKTKGTKNKEQKKGNKKQKKLILS